MRHAPWMLAWLAAGCAAQPEDGNPMRVAPTVARRSDETEVAPVPSAASQAVLAELVGRSRQLPAVRPTAPDGRTRVGSETGAKGPDATPTPALPPPRQRRPGLHAGPIEVQPAVSSPAIEREARAQIYWRLRNCKQADGTPPPPDAIVLDFIIQGDGTIEPSSVKATTEDRTLEPVAACVLRTFAASPFTGPAAARNASARVVITWPSVD